MEFLLENRDELAQKRGKGTQKPANNRFLRRIMADFPGEDVGKIGGCKALGACLKVLIAKYVKNVPEANDAIPLVKRLIPIIYDVSNGAGTQYKSFKDAFSANPAIHKLAQDVLHRSQLEAKMEELAKDRKVMRTLTDGSIRTFTDVYVLRTIQELKSGTMPERFCSAQLSIGSRSIELLSPVFKFERDPEHRPGYIYQIGVAKSRRAISRKRMRDKRDKELAEADEENDDEEDDDEPEEYEPDLSVRVFKPVIGLTLDEFFELLKQIRNWTHNDRGLDNRLLSAKFNKRISDVVKIRFGPARADEQLGSHYLRSVYGQISYLLIASENSVSLSGWLRLVFGHSAAYSTRNYETVLVKREIRAVFPASATLLAVQTASATNSATLDELKQQLETIEVRLREGKEDAAQGIPIRVGWSLFRTKHVPPRWVWLEKRKKTRGNDDDDFQSAVDWAEGVLRRNNVAITNTNIRKLGLGAAAVNSLWSKAACDQEPYINSRHCPPVIEQR